MELLDRYLHSVRWWLPNEQKDDIAAELSEDLRSEIDEKEAGLGRGLTDREIEAILKRRGHPMVVAARFLPQGYLIGPVLFPIYEKVLRAVGTFYVGPWIAVWLVMMIVSPSYRASRMGIRLLGDFVSLVQIILWAFAIITVIFAVVQQTQEKLLADWSPRRLPRVRDRNRVQRSNSIAEIIATVIALAWWLALPRILGGNLFLPHGVWDDFQRLFFIPVAVLVIAAAVMAVIDLARPHRTRVRLAVRAGLNAASAAMALVVLAMHRGPVTAEIRSIRLHTIVQAEAPAIGVDLAVFGVLLGVAAISAGMCLYEMFRVFRWKG
jgi:hypothetical protein